MINDNDHKVHRTQTSEDDNNGLLRSSHLHPTYPTRLQRKLRMRFHKCHRTTEERNTKLGNDLGRECKCNRWFER